MATLDTGPSSRFRAFRILFILVFISTWVEADADNGFKQDSSVLASFSGHFEGREVELEKLIMDPLTNRLYVGAVNHLYDLSPVDLSIREQAVTGPRPDSLLCADTLRRCTEPLVQTNSYTKALAIDQDSNKLIECTSLYQGRCRIRNLSNIGREADVKTSRPGQVANDQHSSTVVFVGSGPTSAGLGSLNQPSKVLYVASTYVPVPVGPRDALDVPAVSSLLLDPSRLFEYTAEYISSGTLMKLDYLHRPNFQIHYVGGVEANGFAYFATTQPKYTGEGQPTISKLIRVCTGDSYFYSYTEVPLECVKNGVHYNLLQDISLGNPGFDLANDMDIKVTDQVIFAVFTRGEGPERNVSTRESAICLFPIKQIENKFFENIRECYNGNTRTNLPWFNSNKKCTQTKYPDSEIMCGKDVNSYIGGEIPIVSHASLTEHGVHFNSIATTSVQSATVALVGTQGGQILKIILEGNDKSRVYKRIQLTDGSPLLQDVELDEKNGLLYAISRSHVYKVNIRQCTPATDCHSCLEAGDPFCGWCMRQSQCVTEEGCIGGEIRDANNQRIGTIPAKNDWFNYRSGRCPLIRSIDPQEQQITSSKILSISMENLPSSLEGFSCSFVFPNLQTFKIPASVTANGVSCPTPTRVDLNNLDPVDKNVKVGLQAHLTILKAHDNSPLASTNFTFYDCHQLQTCTECASSRFPCDWCTISSKCVPNAEDVCQGEPLVNAVSRQGPSSRRGPEFCPRFTPLEEDAEIFVPSGHRRKLTLKVHNVHNSMRNFKCQYTVDQSTHERPATRVGDKIQCDELRFEYFSRGYGNGTARAEFAVVWWPDSAIGQSAGGVASVSSLISSALSAPRDPVVSPGASSSRSRTITIGPGFKLDNSEDFHVIIYKCDQLASNCGTCLGLEVDRFECGWCSTETRCSHLDSCSVTSETSWFARRKDSSVSDLMCPFPRIDSFYPKKGPINGGTKITINGVNLGLKFSHVRDSVRVANVKCDVSEHDYLPSQKIVCHTRSPSQRQSQAQHVVIKLKDDPQFTAVSNDTFMYVNPKIVSFRPFRGPRSGGTDVTVMGEDLDSGASFNLTIGNSPCHVFQRSSTMVVCRTGPSHAEGAEYLVVNTDGTQVKVDNVQFQYTQNPIVDRVTRPVSIVSGGIAVDVFGKGLDLLQRPRMVVTHEDKVYLGQRCEVLDEHLMVCRTPGLDDLPLHRRASLTVDRPLLADYGFDLDGQLTGNLTIERSLPKLVIYDDPRIVPFGEILTVKPSGDLVIKGASLNVAASTRDVRVVVDGKPCNVTALASSTLTCLLHPELSDDDMEVVVFVGQRSERVGVISQSMHNSSSSLYVVAFVLAFIGIFMSITLVCLYRRKNTSHNKQLRYLKNQMNSIEIKVAQECKAAFVELQTSMNAITHSVPQGASAIPLLPYKDYAARILFPQNFINHPVLSELAVEAERAESIESGLRQLNRLLLNPNFLLSFVRTIDENKYLLLKDRVYVGSLIMVILQGHMEYCTEILKILLKELIRKNLDGKFQPKILFRRAESVAERMLSAWFSFLMHRFLEQAAGKELYQLYWSIKQQTEKGPQDAITMDARYSLSEEKLLRSSIEVNELTVYVLSDGTPGALYDVPVKVLDCDSICQVKEKCLDAKYRTTPFSQRPHPNEVDIELRTPTHRMLLQDLDATSKAENGVWKYNTLAHYKIENKATLALIPRPTSGSVYNLSMLSDKSDKSSPMSVHNSSLHQSHGHLHMGPTNSPTLSRPFGTTSTGYNKDVNNSVKVMHLVKPMDHGSQDNEDKLVTEVYLTRLLTMKGTLKQFIKRNLKMILSVNNGVTALPLCIKYMFDFLDEQAAEHGIDDPDVVHAWKSNALPLRFWVNLIKNPDFVFDIPKPTKIEGSLNVVAQTLMDACSTQDQLLTKDSPSSKLLFADVMDEYKIWVQDYYRAIREMPPVKEEQMSAFLAEESRNHANDFRVFSALNELYVYVHQNKEAVQEELSQNDVAIHQQLPEKFQKLLDTMEVIPDALIMNSGSLENYNSKSRLMSNSANRFY